MMTKILLVDDEKDIIEFLKYNLEKEGFNVISAYNGLEALNLIKEKPDLIILDIMMPGMDGFEVCKKIRETNGFEHTPIIFLTAKANEIDEIKGLDLGANDYIMKPISTKKIIARVKANLRNQDFKKINKKIEIGPLEIDRDKYEIKIDGKTEFFPRKEFELLFFLADNPGKVFNRETLLKEIWGDNIYVVDRTVDVHIRKIREKFDIYADLIETVKGIGYRFKNVQ